MKAEIKFLQLDYSVESSTNPKEDRIGYLYIHKRLDTGHPFYVGISCDKNFSRAKDIHGRNKLWKNIVKKCNYRIEILFQNIPINILLQKETEFIKIYGRIDIKTGILSNLSNGGETRNDFSPTEQTRRKIKITHIKSRIVQLNRNNEILYIWNNSIDPEKFNYISSTIIKCCKNNIVHGNSYWKYYDDIDWNNHTNDYSTLTPIYNKYNEKDQILQIDSTDNIIQVYTSFSDIVSLGFASSPLKNVLNGVYKSTGGYSFKYYNKDLHNISHIDRNINFPPKLQNIIKRIVKCDINGNVVKHYITLKTAIDCGDISRGKLTYNLRCGTLCDNHYWQYYDKNIHGNIIFKEPDIEDNNKICQIGRGGFIINIFDNIYHLHQLNYNIDVILSKIKQFNSYKTHQFEWKYYDASCDLTNCEYKYFKCININKKPIIHFNKKGKFVKLYEGSADVDKTKFNRKCVSNCCTGKSLHHNNHKFQFLKDYLKENPNFVPNTPNDINIYENFIFNEKHKIPR